jgi:hypothetical protein
LLKEETTVSNEREEDDSKKGSGVELLIQSVLADLLAVL